MRKKKGKALFLSSCAAFEDAVWAAEYGRAAGSNNSALHPHVHLDIAFEESSVK